MAADRSAKLARRFNHYRQSSRPAKRKIWVRLASAREAGGEEGREGPSFDIRVPRWKVIVEKTVAPLAATERKIFIGAIAPRLWRRHSATINNSRPDLPTCGYVECCIKIRSFLFVICYDKILDASFIISFVSLVINHFWKTKIGIINRLISYNIAIKLLFYGYFYIINILYLCFLIYIFYYIKCYYLI